jgi:predicted TIM-barrel fold metal-dependent hydrolase
MIINCNFYCRAINKFLLSLLLLGFGALQNLSANPDATAPARKSDQGFSPKDNHANKAKSLTDPEVIKTELIRYMSTLDIIDAHEHLCTEKQHLTNYYTFYNWFIPYVQYDLMSAGMPAENLWRAPDSDKMTIEYWKEIKPLWEYVKYGSYAEPVLMALKEFYGMDDITDENYMKLGEKMRATRYPGRYQEILQDRCHIKYMLNQANIYGYPEGDFMKGSIILVNIVTTAGLQKYKRAHPQATIDEYLTYMQEEIRKARLAGSVLAKFDASCFVFPPNREKAEAAFRNFDTTSVFLNQSDLGGFLFDRMIDMATSEGLVICIHTGVWGNINIKNPELIYPVIERHPKSTFDIYHMGMPYVNECGFLGKNYPNVYLNLTWSHIVSSRMTIEALDQWLDYVPLNKISAFGGDFITMPELIWAHLEIAKRNLAEVFSRRIMRGQLTMEQSKQILKMWFYDNPARIYGLDK